MNEPQAKAALGAIVLEIPAAKRPRFEALYKAWAGSQRARVQVDTKLASGGRFGVYSAYFTALKQKANQLPTTVAALRSEFPKQADRSMAIGVSTGFGEALMRDWGPLLIAAASVAAIGASGALNAATYGLNPGAVSTTGAGALPATGATSAGVPGSSAVASSATVADTYAAMNAAAGISSSGGVAADIALASAVQTGALPVAAAQSYASAIASGAITAGEVTSGLAATYGIGGSATMGALDVAKSLPVPKPAPKPVPKPAPPPAISDTSILSRVGSALETGVGVAASAVGVYTAVAVPAAPPKKVAPTPVAATANTTNSALIAGGLALAAVLLF